MSKLKLNWLSLLLESVLESQSFVVGLIVFTAVSELVFLVIRGIR